MTDTARAAFAAKYPALDAEVSLGENNPDYRGIEDIRGRHALNYFRAGWQAAIVSREAEIADARRYRWLREYGFTIYNDIFNDDLELTVEEGARKLDAAIDAAIDQEKP